MLWSVINCLFFHGTIKRNKGIDYREIRDDLSARR